MSETAFALWLEFEHWEREEGHDPEDDGFERLDRTLMTEVVRDLEHLTKPNG
jgi:hypothetical protein